MNLNYKIERVIKTKKGVTFKCNTTRLNAPNIDNILRIKEFN